MTESSSPERASSRQPTSTTAGEPLLASGAVALSASDRLALVQAIHAAPGQIVLAVTGGGMQVVTDLMLVPGASRTVLEIAVPYAATALAEMLSLENDEGSEAGAVAVQTARRMARSAHHRAVSLADGGETSGLAGVACTAALVTDRTRRGADRACIAYVNAAGEVGWEVSLDKAGPDEANDARVAQDRAVSDVLLRAIAAAIGVTTAT